MPQSKAAATNKAANVAGNDPEKAVLSKGRYWDTAGKITYFKGRANASTPNKMHISAKTTQGTHIKGETSLIERLLSVSRRCPRNTAWSSLIKLASVSAEPKSAQARQIAGISACIDEAFWDMRKTNPWYISHFETKPLNGGIPDMDKLAIRVEK